ncbi:PREDICTED: rab3 GTPase-activating protein catalytic subunit [Thamnophis sirtalis]|uniref:Rab3 GTPase-activating protein catalytic subunit n=1 Tax=Thamnophis sirtalis TaxID=35019 RepID=A0A6I9XHN7_9SAUR|nr:PREDICTED: rab3 GTPase-activating protein catalytic subunit [Thamnophis sirtalis]
MPFGTLLLKMAADSEPESEVFEITDFTTASEWERFISRVEEVLNDWKLINISSGKPLEKGVYTTETWEEKSDEITFADFRFSVTHHYLAQKSTDKNAKDELVEDVLPVAMQDLLCMNNDFPPRAHCLVRWYGLRELVVIAPAANNEAVLSESKCNLLLSSVSIALGNTGCQVPVFVQIHHRHRKMYVGECQGPGVRTDFEMVHLRKVPSQYSHLSGLLDIFKSKIGCPLTPLPAINISIRLTYILQDWQQYFWPQQPPDIDALVGGEVGGVEFGKLPFGACEDPISELHLAATWPHLTEGIIVDNDVYSDLDPAQAPQWSVRVKKADNPQCLLSDFVTEFFKLCRRKESTDEILGRSAFEEEGKDADISHALSKLTEPAPVPIHKLSVTNMVHTAKKKIRKHRGIDESPLNNEVLNTVLMYLFPDAVDKSADGSEARTNTSTGSIPPPDNEDSNLYIQFKSAPSDSLTYKLALCLCMINFYHGGVKGVAHLWQEFVLEMRYRWENNFFIPGAANPGCCLEDFVRWYSPRDYIEEETVDESGGVVIKGELSARMKIPSNMWVEAWETAKPVPARRQRRLFDDTREAEKVLHYLAIQKPADLARHLLSCVIHAAVLKVKEEESLEDIGLVKKIIKQIISHSSKVLRFPNPEDKKLEEIIGQIMNVEATIARARSLKAKFGIEKCTKEEERKDLEKFVNSFLEQPEVSVLGARRGPAGIIIHKLFVNAQRVAPIMPYDEELKRSGSMDEKRFNSGMSSDFPPPAGREVILRTTVPRPAPYSKPLPQRMYSVLTKDDFRLAGAFSSDTTFF